MLMTSFHLFFVRFKRLPTKRCKYNDCTRGQSPIDQAIASSFIMLIFKSLSIFFADLTSHGLLYTRGRRMELMMMEKSTNQKIHNKNTMSMMSVIDGCSSYMICRRRV